MTTIPGPYISIRDRRGGAAGLLTLPIRNTDSVQWSSYNTIPIDFVTKTGGSTAGLSLLSNSKSERMVGNGSINQIMFENTTTTNIILVHFYIWRYNYATTTFDKIYEEDILSKIDASNSIKTINLATTVNIKEGDMCGFTYRSTGATVFTRTYIVGGGTTLYFTSYNPSDPTDWNSKSSVGYKLVTNTFGQAPYIVMIGDSITSCYPVHTSCQDTDKTEFEPSKSWEYKLHALDNRFIYQNQGNYGETLAVNIIARFTRDAIDRKPKFLYIGGGTNDCNAGTVLYSTFISAWTTILNDCITNSIIPIVNAIMPRTAMDNTTMKKRDAWNAGLKTLFDSYNRTDWIYINWDLDLGQFRAGGDAGNLWDIKTEYNYDNTHFLETGYTKIAEVVLREIGKVYAL